MKPAPIIVRRDQRSPIAKLNRYLTLEFPGPENKGKPINVIPGFTYSFRYFDAKRQEMITASNVQVLNILNVTRDPKEAVIQFINTPESDVVGVCDKNQTHFQQARTMSFPLANLKEISYYGDEQTCTCTKDTWRNIIMVLGITATEMQIIILKLKFFNDSSSESFKQIVLKPNTKYKFTYYSYKEETSKEVTGTLKCLTRTEKPVEARPDCFIRESESVQNMFEEIIEEHEFVHQKPVHDFFDCDKMYHDYQLLIEKEDGQRGYFYLSQLRDCDVVETESTEPDNPGDEDMPGCCNCPDMVIF